MPTVEQQNAGAFNGDIGITSPIFNDENCAARPARTAPRAKTGGAPGDRRAQARRVTFYTRTLAVPARRDVGSDARPTAGERSSSGSAATSCHLPELRTGDSDIPRSRDQIIRPYTDLLLHDMGAGSPTAAGLPRHRLEWRTPPLWGIGLVTIVNRHTRFLHDGRARNLAEAILWHGGEAHAARERSARCRARERRELLAFLESL